MTTPTNTDQWTTFAGKRGDIYLDALLKIRTTIAGAGPLTRTEVNQVIADAIAEAQDAVHAAASGTGLSGHGVESGAE